MQLRLLLRISVGYERFGLPQWAEYYETGLKLLTKEQRQRKLAGRDGRGRFGGGTNQHTAVGSHYSGYSAYGHGVLPFDAVGYHNGTVDWSGRWKAPSVYEQFLLTFKALVCESQCFVREANGGERSSVSLRDVARDARVFKSFLRYYSQLQQAAIRTRNRFR